MSKWLRQSTASQEIVIGRMVDATDGNTAETGLTIANTDIDIWRTGATTLADKNSGGATHIAGGLYSAVLDATDTATLGPMKIFVQVAGALAWEDSYTVVPAQVYDSIILGTDLLDVSAVQLAGTALTGRDIGASVLLSSGTGTGQVSITSGVVSANAVQISGDSTAADNLELAYDFTAGPVPSEGVIDQGTAQSATGTTLVLRSAAAFANDELVGATVVITGGTTGVGQSRLITGYVGSTDTATVETWSTTPTGTITYRIYGTAPGTSGSGLDAAGVRAAIGLASANLDTQLSTIDTVVDAILVDTAVIGSTGQGLTSLATQASVNTIDDFLDTEIAAILADTNELQTDWANGGRLDLIVDAILADTGTDGVVVASASKTGYALSAAGVDAIWDEAQSGHATAGTFGVYLDSAVSGVSTGGVSAADIADAVWDEDLAGHATAGSAGDALSDAAAGGGGGGLDAAGVRAAVGLASANLDTQLSALQSDTDNIQTRLPASLVSGRMDASVGAMAANVLTAAATATDFTTEVTNGLATASAVSTVQTAVDTIDDLLDTEVAAIKAKTDQLTFGVTNTLNANIEYVNAVQITGNGQTGTEWGPV